MGGPREMTPEECRDELLSHVHRLIAWWLNESRAVTPREKMEGLAFSILSALDGCAGALPRFAVTPSPHPEAAAYHRGRGENWWPTGCDLGPLQEHFHRPRPGVTW